MAMKTTKRVAKKVAKKRAPRRKMRVPRSRKFAQPEWASCSETLRVYLPGTEGNTLQTNTMYGPSLINLLNYQRASAISENYQQYRITGVTYKFTPRFDTFPATTNLASQIAVPYFYYMIDRIGAIRDTVTLTQLQSMGAKPHRFDDKSVIVKYKPSVLVSVGSDQNATSIPSQYKISPWLNVQQNANDNSDTPSEVDHRGLWFILDAKSLPGDATYQYDCDITVEFQFRKALVATPTGEPNPNYGGDILNPRPVQQ